MKKSFYSVLFYNYLRCFLIIGFISIFCVSCGNGNDFANNDRVDSETIFHVTYGGEDDDYGYSVISLPDGGYVVVGSTTSFGAGGQDVYLIRTDSSGNLLWEETFGGSQDDIGYSVDITTTGEYVIVGKTGSIGSGGDDVYLIKTDSSGNLLWEKNFGGPQNDVGYSVKVTTDGGYVISGSMTSSGAGDTDVYLIRTDSFGNLVWEKTFGGLGNDCGFFVLVTTDGGYITGGQGGSYEKFNNPFSVYIVKTYQDGTLEWENGYQMSEENIGRDILQAEDGGYFVVGDVYFYHSGGNQISLHKIDSFGFQEWQGNISSGGGESTFGRSAAKSEGGGYIIAGYDFPYWDSDRLGGNDMFLVKTDSEGNSIWKKHIGGAGDDHGESIKTTADGGYIVAGYTDSFGAGENDVYLVKIIPAETP